MSTGHDVIVAGVGAMGAATCAALARRGVRVLGLEAASIPNPSSSHAGHTRVFRVAYAEHPDYVPLLKRARAAWRRLEEERGEDLYRECGVLYVGPRAGELITATASTAAAHGVPHQRLDRRELAHSYPQFNAPDDWEALLEPEAGWVAAESGVSALAASALCAGAEIRTGEPVLDWSERADGVVVRTPSGEHRADRLVVTSGAWAPRLLARLGIELRVTRQVLLWVWPRRPKLFADDRFPVWAMQGACGFAYGFPLAPGRVGLKLALHEPGEAVDPDAVPRELRPDERDRLLGVLAEHLPGAMGPVLSHSTCIYTNSPDGHFVIDRCPGSERAFFGAGFSGHGFKFAPIIGEALTDLATAGRTDLPIGFLGLARFASEGPR